MNLTDKKTIIVVSVLMFFALMLSIQLVIRPTKNEIAKLDKKITAKTKELGELAELKKEYNDIVTATRAMEIKVQRSAKNVTLPSLLENVARATHLTEKMTGLKIMDTIKSKDFSENGAEISLRDISIDELMSFVYNLESQPYIIKVKGFKFKTTYGKEPKYINLTLTVSLFTPN